MDRRETTYPVARKAQSTWNRYLLFALLAEKTIQHLAVTVAFYFNWADIRSIVAVNPRLLMITGAVVTLLFVASLWGMLRPTKWVINLVLALALFDIMGEFVAQGKIRITMTVSFLVATLLLILTLFYRRQGLKTE